MMVQVEGHIVESLYEAFLLSWNVAFNPTLPSLSITLPTLSEEYLQKRWEENGKEFESVEKELGIDSIQTLNKHLGTFGITFSKSVY